MENEQFGFTVDTHLFRELGELLVGRESTALMELIKNAYDADATQVLVRGEGLRKPGGTISIIDNGIGMTPEIFRSSFLRIAGRYKEGGSRTSLRFSRRYTGSKGVGRLSAHKLAHRLRIRSVPDAAIYHAAESAGIDAIIDWRRLEEEFQTVDNVGPGLVAHTFPLNPNEVSSTELHLESLRRAWSPRALSRFVQQIGSATPPEQLLASPAFQRSDDEKLFDELQPWTRLANDPGFNVIYEGDLNAGDELWLRLVERANWLLEIRSTVEGVEFSVLPSPYHLERVENASAYRFSRQHPDPEHGPFFVARIYAREGSTGASASDFSQFAEVNSGVRVYLEGFRVIPYGEPGDDWLDLNRDYARRPRTFDIPLDSTSNSILAIEDKEGFLTLGNDQYFGGVFLTGEGASSLRPVVNREGFLRDASFDHLRELVRNGIDLLTRVRAATGRRATTDRRAKNRSVLEGDSEASYDTRSSTTQEGASETLGDASAEDDSGKAVRASLDDEFTNSIMLARRHIDELRSEVSSDSTASTHLTQLEAALNLAEQVAEQQGADRAMLQVLAGIGLQFAAFVHEVNGILGQAQSVRSLIEIVTEPTDQQALVRVRRDLRVAADELVQSLSRQASYLTEVVGPDARRRRRRIPLNRTAETSLRLLSSTIAARRIQIIERLNPQVRTPPIFPAEMMTILTNLLTNAIKAAGEGGRIMLEGDATAEGGISLRVENTGRAVQLEDGERWFQPFESTTTDVDVVLGQGMGLGLPITRRMVNEYHGTVQFVAPSTGYSTAVEVVLPPREVRR